MNMDSMLKAIEFIKTNGLSFATELRREGAVGVMLDAIQKPRLVWIDMERVAPLREIIKVDAGYRVKSTHLTPPIDLVGKDMKATADALYAFYKETGYTIAAIEHFNVLGSVVALFNRPTPESEWAINSTPQKEISMSDKNKSIIEAVLSEKGNILDGHRGTPFLGRTCYERTQVSHIAIFGKPGEREQIVALFEGQEFSINSIFRDLEGHAMLCTAAVGAPVNGRKNSIKQIVAGYTDLSGNTMWGLQRVDGQVDLEEELEALSAPVVEPNPYPTPDRSGWEPINPKIQVNNFKIIEAVLAAKGNIRDTHQFEKMIQVSHVALFGVPGYKEKVVCLLEGKLFCINPIYLDHDEPYLCTNSVGGNLMHKELPMLERLPTYQDWDHNILWNLTRVDGK